MSAKSAEVRSVVRRPSLSTLVIASFFLVVFLVAFFLMWDLPFRAAFFPRIASMFGAVCSGILLIGEFWQRRAVSPPMAVASASGEGGDTPDSGSADYAFESATRKDWLVALVWPAGFFVSLWIFGLFVTVPLFCVFYLRGPGGARWLGAVVYAAVAGSVCWIAFRVLLHIQVPTGLFGW